MKPPSVSKLSRLQKLILSALLEPVYASLKRREFGAVIKVLYGGDYDPNAVAGHVLANSLSRALKHLEERGLIERTASCWQLVNPELAKKLVGTELANWALSSWTGRHEGSLALAGGCTPILQQLYILVFKNEPLFKVGLSMDIHLRCRVLGWDRFDLNASFLVQAFDQAAISVLERNLKTFFWSYSVASPEPLPNGNTETFHRAALPKMLAAIETLRVAFPLAQFRTQQDLSSLMSLGIAPQRKGAEVTLKF